mgnify:CR=1 FL=1
MNHKLSLQDIYKYWWIPTIFVIIAIAIITMVPAMLAPAPTFVSIKNNTALTSTLVSGQNTSRYTVTMVYRDGCPYCESARKTIEHELSTHNKDVIQFSQIDGTTPQGKSLLKKFNAKGVPLIIVTDTNNNVSHSFNDSDANGIKKLLSTYAF